MNHEASSKTEATLWQLYRRLLAGQLLEQRLAAFHRSLRRYCGPGTAVAAALAENLLEGDSLGLAPGDLVTRYLCGVPLAVIREAAGAGARRTPDRTRKHALDWQYPADAERGLLPGIGEEQASLALGTALAARLHTTGCITVLVESRGIAIHPASAQPASGRHAPTREDHAHPESLTPLPDWAPAAQTAVALRLPLLFVTLSVAGQTAPDTGPTRRAPTLPSIPVDRSDTLALYRVIYESAARARAGGGPTWVECRDATAAGRPRQPGSTPDANPLETMEQALTARKLLHREQQRQLQRALAKEFAGWPVDAG